MHTMKLSFSHKQVCLKIKPFYYTVEFWSSDVCQLYLILVEQTTLITI